jgi:hypothetical protein
MPSLPHVQTTKNGVICNLPVHGALHGDEAHVDSIIKLDGLVGYMLQYYW